LKAVLFDLEGTLVETLYQRSLEDLNQLRKEVKKKLISLGVPDEVLIGLVSTTLLRNKAYEWSITNMNQAESARLHTELDVFMKPYEMIPAKKARLYPDTLESLQKLASRGVKMGIVTNTSREAAKYMLKKFGLEGFFKVVVTRNDAPCLKPDPAMIHVAITRMERAVGWLVGDMRFDAEAARRAGLKSIIVRRDGVRPSFTCDYIVDSLIDVESILFEDNEASKREN
jgi:HAD superfamily hydrolase (TIGR01509 family)